MLAVTNLSTQIVSATYYIRYKVLTLNIFCYKHFVHHFCLEKIYAEYSADVTHASFPLRVAPVGRPSHHHECLPGPSGGQS